MKKTFFILLSFLFFVNVINVKAQTPQISKARIILQKRGEVYFSFELNNEINSLLTQIGKTISIDNVKNGKVYAYANKKEFEQFLSKKIDFEILTPPSMILSRDVVDKRPVRNTNSWDYYPTYTQYVDIMNGFANDYPGLCELVNIGQTVEGRDLLFIHINDSLGTAQNEPQFMYTATMHGDETTPYVLMLHLIDYLLSNYGTDAQVTNLVNNIDIWINPLANPDGTYAGGNNTVYGATRTNGNNIDLNRNYPDPEDGPHPDGNAYQPETTAFMDFAEDNNFVLSCNMHTGAEVANYPWDTWYRRHADDDWWIYVCRQYADTVHAYAPAGYFTDLDNGITNGYDWYSISGGRQDYMNYFQNCREFTLELSENKMPPPSQLPDFWDYNYRSFLNYMQQSLYGVRGIITNKQNGNAVKAEVFVENHDEDNSQVFSALPIGNYHRPIKGGTYDFTFSAFGYHSVTVNNVSPADESTVFLNIQLPPLGVMFSDFTAIDTVITTGEGVNFYDESYSDSIASWQWTFEGGTPEFSYQQNPENVVYNNLGEYDVTLTITDTSGAVKTTVKQNYIKVINATNMQNGTITTCSILFFDSGGANGNYSDKEDYVITFIPETANSVIKVQFLHFNLENSLNCSNDFLAVYDGNDTTADLIGKYCGNQIQSVFFGHNDGSLTFRFHSNDTISEKGWKALVTCDTNTGTDLETANNNINIFPNPAHKTVNIYSTETINKITLFASDGKCLISKTTPFKKTTLNINSLSSGLYIVKIETPKGIVTKKLLVDTGL